MTKTSLSETRTGQTSLEIDSIMTIFRMELAQALVKEIADKTGEDQDNLGHEMSDYLR